jgi:hypothetical protein
MQIMYKGNWSKAINIDDSDGVFCGREKELQQLQSFLINNNSGSILISGLRGVGKTTFIYKTIQNLKIYYSKTKTRFIPIVLSAPQIELDKKILSTSLLKTIIRRIYADLTSIGNKEIDELYKKANSEYLSIEERDECNDVEIVKTSESSIKAIVKWDVVVAALSAVVGTSLIMKAEGIFLKIIGIFVLIVANTTFSFASINKKDKKR